MIQDIIRKFCADPKDCAADSSAAPKDYDELLPELAGYDGNAADIGRDYEPCFLPFDDSIETAVTFFSAGAIVPFSELKEGELSEVLLTSGRFVNYRSGFMARKENGSLKTVCRSWQVLHTVSGDLQPGQLNEAFRKAAEKAGLKNAVWSGSYLPETSRFIFYLETENPKDLPIAGFEKELSDELGAETSVYILMTGTFDSHRKWRISHGIPEKLYFRPEVLTCVSDREFLRNHMDIRF
jgi:hypothetical protein